MSISISDLRALQKNFDLTHNVKGKSFYTDITEENISELEHLAVCLAGEVGEFCNVLKKMVRGDVDAIKGKEALSEELADCLIYIIKISNQYKIDIEKETLNKIKSNMSRFEEN